MSIVTKFECPECNQEHELIINEAFEIYNKEIHRCKRCGIQFVIEHKASITTKVFTINNKASIVTTTIISSNKPPKYKHDGILMECVSQGYIGYVVAIDPHEGHTGYMELFRDGDITGEYVFVDLSCLTVSKVSTRG